MEFKAQIDVTVITCPGEVAVRIADRRPETIALYEELNETHREQLAFDAWSVGQRAVANAYRQAEEARLADIGQALRDDLERECRSFVARQEETLVQVLTRYFDPKDGKVVARLDSFLRDGGELTTAMEKYLSPERGLLAQTLAREVGLTSPIFKMLSPTESQGVVQVMQNRIEEALGAHHADFLRALDPLCEDGAVARFLKSLRDQLRAADADREQQLATAVKALDANDENSLLSRLIRETELARQHLLTAMNPEIPGSPLGVLKNALTDLLQQHATGQREAFAAFEEKQIQSTNEIRETVARFDERRRNDARSVRGGFSFQDAVVRFVMGSTQGAPILTDVTANTVGSLAGCKVGDLVLELTTESAFPGAKVVIEAKREQGFTVQNALKEVEVARANRGASAGVFVLSRAHAPLGFPPFARHGSDVLVLWDDSDDLTDPYLHAALLLALSVASRSHRPEDSGNIAALSDIEHRIQNELERLEKMRDLASKIERQAHELQDEIRKGGDKLDLILRKAKKTLKALDVELEDAPLEAAPIALPHGSLEAGRVALLER
ncbi:MAG TPA: hypothetical protein VLV78_07015 [Thermoanaerobaculia bacterium]|nr:hypothetical protein [Thermoanaerobaculia bacterium]